MRKLFILLGIIALSECRAQQDSLQQPDHEYSQHLIVPKFDPLNDWQMNPAPSNVNKKKACLVLGGEIIGGAASFAGLYNVWYKDYVHEKFHIFYDGPEWRGMDKCGHIITSYTVGKYGANSFHWFGLNAKKSVFIGGLLGVTYQTVLEIFDAYSTGWGFSPGDMTANAAGYLLYAGQFAIWKEQRIIPKFSFVQSGFAQYRPELLGKSKAEQLFKDYNGQTYWLSFNLRSFMHTEHGVPAWLNVAVGYGASGMTGGRSNPAYYNYTTGNYENFARYSQFYISPDIDLSKIPCRSIFVRRLLSTFNFLKIPLPGLMMANGKLSAQLISH